jgi:phage host-nuclease inhibitor protein Gam
MGHKVKNYSANHRDEITRMGKTGKKKAADIAACCSRLCTIGILV